MSDIYQDSLLLHKKYGGKLSIKSKVSLSDKKDLSLAYTPGVAEVCRVIAGDQEQAYPLTLKGNTVAVVTDGSAILGLGNLGAKAAIPVMEGKCILFKEFADVDAIPICLDTQDTEEIIKTIKYLAPSFGGINLEDISAPRCFEIENRLKQDLDIPVMHDDQHGTAVVVLAGLINALKLRDLEKSEARVVVNGAGAAGTAIIKLLLQYGLKDIITIDRTGIIYEGRHGLTLEKSNLAKLTNHKQKRGGLTEAIDHADVFIGVSQPAILTPEMIKTMNDQPIIFALANPVPEIMPDLAKEAGAFIIATGRSDYPNQINNVLAFPGIFRGALNNRVKQITDKMLIKTAEIIASLVENPNHELILPNPFDKKIAPAIARAIN